MRSVLPGILIYAVAAVFATVLLVVLGGRGGQPSLPPAQNGLAREPLAAITLKPGPNQKLVSTYCTICHSLAPIVEHDGFTNATWSAEVQKMRKTYGCPIDDATARQILTYLQASYSAESRGMPAPGNATPVAPGTRVPAASTPPATVPPATPAH